MISVIIPCYKDELIHKTIDSLLENSEGEVEIIPVLDGFSTPIKSDPRIKTIKLEKNIGMRGAVNAGLKVAKGDFVMKVDSHCLFGKGYDKIMTDDCQENWLMIPRRYPLHASEWRIDKRMYIKDYHYLAFPARSIYGYGLFPMEWKQRTYERFKDPKFIIDDTMTFQGSCWLANRKYFMEHVGFLDDREETYGTFSGEPLEVGLKYWLGGGEVKVTKKTYYAHLFKNSKYYKSEPDVTREYKLDKRTIAGHTWGAKHWVNNREPNMVRPFSWLVEKFMPVPGWTEEREKWQI